MFGSTLPFVRILEFIRQIANNNNIKLCRMIARKKDAAIEWLCQHIDIIEPHLVDCDSSSSSSSRSKAERVERNSSNIVEIDNRVDFIFRTQTTMKELVDADRRWGNLLNIKLDLDAKRNKLTFDCWISEHFDVIKNLLIQPLQFEIPQPPPTHLSPVPIISCPPDDWDIDPNADSWSIDESMFNLEDFDFK